MICLTIDIEEISVNIPFLLIKFKLRCIRKNKGASNVHSYLCSNILTYIGILTFICMFRFRVDATKENAQFHSNQTWKDTHYWFDCEPYHHRHRFQSGKFKLCT